MDKPFELKCFKSVNKVPRKVLFDLYTRPLNKNRNLEDLRAHQQRLEAFRDDTSTDMRFYNTDCCIPETADDYITQLPTHISAPIPPYIPTEYPSIHNDILDDIQPRAEIPKPQSISSNEQMCHSTLISPRHHSTLINNSVPSNVTILGATDSFAQQIENILEGKQPNIKSPTVRSKSQPKRQKLKQRRTEENRRLYLQNALASYDKIHNLLSDPFFTDNKQYPIASSHQIDTDTMEQHNTSQSQPNSPSHQRITNEETFQSQTPSKHRCRNRKRLFQYCPNQKSPSEERIIPYKVTPKSKILRDATTNALNDAIQTSQPIKKPIHYNPPTQGISTDYDFSFPKEQEDKPWFPALNDPNSSQNKALQSNINQAIATQHPKWRTLAKQLSHHHKHQAEQILYYLSTNQPLTNGDIAPDVTNALEKRQTLSKSSRHRREKAYQTHISKIRKVAKRKQRPRSQRFDRKPNKPQSQSNRNAVEYSPKAKPIEAMPETDVTEIHHSEEVCYAKQPKSTIDTNPKRTIKSASTTKLSNKKLQRTLNKPQSHTHIRHQSSTAQQSKVEKRCQSESVLHTSNKKSIKPFIDKKSQRFRLHFAVRLQILQSIHSEMKIQKYSFHKQYSEIDTKYREIFDEYHTTLNAIPKTQRKKQMISSQHGKMNLKSQTIQSQIGNGLCFKVSILGDLLHKLSIQRMFIRWKCSVYLRNVRNQFLSKLERRETHLLFRLIFDDWKTTTKRQKMKYRTAQSMYDYHCTLTVRTHFDHWCNEASEVRRLSSIADQHRYRKLVQSQNSLFDWWKHIYLYLKFNRILRSYATSLSLRNLFKKWHRNVSKDQSTAARLAKIQNITLQPCAILKYKDLRFTNVALQSWNHQIRAHKAMLVSKVSFDIPIYTQSNHSIQTRSNIKTTAEILDNLAVLFCKRRRLNHCLQRWVRVARLSKLRHYFTHTQPTILHRQRLQHWRSVTNEFTHNNTIAVEKGANLRCKRAFQRWLKYRALQKTLNIRVSLELKPKAKLRRYIQCWKQWIIEHRQLLLNIRQFELQKQHVLKYRYFYAMKYGFERRMYRHRRMLELECQSDRRRLMNAFQLCKMKYYNRILLRSVFTRAQQLWIYHRNNGVNVKLRNPQNILQKWRIYTNRQKSIRNYKLQSLMATIHRNIYLQSKCFRMWHILFETYRNNPYRHPPQRNFLKNSSKQELLASPIHKSMSGPIKAYPKIQIHSNATVQSESLSHHSSLSSVFTIDSNPDCLHPIINPESLKSISRGSSNFTLNSTPSQSQHSSLTTLHSKSREEISQMIGIKENEILDNYRKSHPLPVILDSSRKHNIRDDGYDDGDTLLALPIELYHFSRKWRYFKPMRKAFFVWKYRHLKRKSDLKTSRKYCATLPKTKTTSKRSKIEQF